MLSVSQKYVYLILFKIRFGHFCWLAKGLLDSNLSILIGVSWLVFREILLGSVRNASANLNHLLKIFVLPPFPPSVLKICFIITHCVAVLGYFCLQWGQIWLILVQGLWFKFSFILISQINHTFLVMQIRNLYYVFCVTLSFRHAFQICRSKLHSLSALMLMVISCSWLLSFLKKQFCCLHVVFGVQGCGLLHIWPKKP